MNRAREESLRAGAGVARSPRRALRKTKPPDLTSSPSHSQPTAPTAAALAYEATAGLTFFILACLWVWSRLAGRRETATPTTTSPFRLSIPALAALFVLQWGAFSFLLLSACCK